MKAIVTMTVSNQVQTECILFLLWKNVIVEKYTISSMFPSKSLFLNFFHNRLPFRSQ